MRCLEPLSYDDLERKGALDNAQADGEDFDVAVEDAVSDRPSKRAKGDPKRAKMSRNARDGKFGFGGVGRRSKQNTKTSTDDFEPGPRSGPGQQFGKRGKGGKKAPPKRPGKSQRMNARTRK